MTPQASAVSLRVGEPPQAAQQGVALRRAPPAGWPTLLNDASQRLAFNNGDHMHQQNEGAVPGCDAAITRRYARLWKSVIDGAVPARDTDVGGWYAAAQHALGTVLHAAEVERISDSTCAAPEDVKHAA